MRKSKIFYQFYKAIALATCLGVDKHSYKKGGCKKVKIFSFEDRRNIIKCINQLCIYIEDSYPDIIKIKDISSEHVNKFFSYKGRKCSKSTMKNYRYCIRKMEKMVQQYLHLRVKYIDEDFKVDYDVDYIRSLEMSSNDISIILNECRNSRSEARLGIELTVLFGLRVAEICKLKGKDINLEDMYIHIHESKGKRSRNIKIDTLEKLEVCTRIKEQVANNERVCKLKEDSVNAVIRRMLIKNKITTYSESKTGVHAIRKSYAKKTYVENLRKFNDEVKAWDKTAETLGHNAGRKSLKNVYVK
ncbi:tyrosine-type recombinase/integrase [Clostridium disporicum]|uniref:tyrosine-type recombinase/integrase n=1 Tax=Clostridium disporicum TaxID=84024 RepID=UPI0034A4359D